MRLISIWKTWYLVSAQPSKHPTLQSALRAVALHCRATTPREPQASCSSVSLNLWLQGRVQKSSFPVPCLISDLKICHEFLATDYYWCSCLSPESRPAGEILPTTSGLRAYPIRHQGSAGYGREADQTLDTSFWSKPEPSTNIYDQLNVLSLSDEAAAAPWEGKSSCFSTPTYPPRPSPDKAARGRIKECHSVAWSIAKFWKAAQSIMRCTWKSFKQCKLASARWSFKNLPAIIKVEACQQRSMSCMQISKLSAKETARGFPKKASFQFFTLPNSGRSFCMPILSFNEVF